jgi:hypothetical protein
MDTKDPTGLAGPRDPTGLAPPRQSSKSNRTGQSYDLAIVLTGPKLANWKLRPFLRRGEGGCAAPGRAKNGQSFPLSRQRPLSSSSSAVSYLLGKPPVKLFKMKKGPCQRPLALRTSLSIGKISDHFDGAETGKLETLAVFEAGRGRGRRPRPGRKRARVSPLPRQRPLSPFSSAVSYLLGRIPVKLFKMEKDPVNDRLHLEDPPRNQSYDLAIVLTGPKLANWKLWPFLKRGEGGRAAPGRAKNGQSSPLPGQRPHSSSKYLTYSVNPCQTVQDEEISV